MAYITITDLPEKNDFPVNNPWFLISTDDTSYKLQWSNIYSVFENAANTYTDDSITALIDGSPSDMNTLKELSAALNNNPSFAQDVLTQIANLTTDNIAEGAGSLYYTEARVDANIASKTTDNLTEGSNLYYTDARVDANIASKTTSDLTEGLNKYFTNERVDDRVSELVQNGDNINVVYDDTSGTLTFNVDATNGLDLSQNNTDDLQEGPVNLYYTDIRAASAFAAGLATSTTDDLQEGPGNLYYTVDRWDDRLSTKSTDDLLEGLANLYFTEARARASLQAGYGLSYDIGSGTYQLDVSTDTQSSTITTTGDADFGGDLFVNGSATVNTDVNVLGNLTVQGALTTIETANLEIADQSIVLNKGAGDTSTNADGAGFVVQDAVNSTTDAFLSWSQPNTNWVLSHDLVTNLIGNVTGDLTGDVFASDGTSMILDTGTDGTDATITADVTGNVVGNVTGQVSDISNWDTSSLAEGTNLYFTNDRVDAQFDIRLATKTTSDLAEGSRLYFTTDRARQSISAGKGLSYDEVSGVVSSNNSVYVSPTEPLDWVVGDVWIETA